MLALFRFAISKIAGGIGVIDKTLRAQMRIIGADFINQCP